MKILYAFQGTGNGHLTRALVIIPILQKFGSVSIAICGNENEVVLPYPIDFFVHGPVFVFGKNGGINWIDSYRKTNLRKFIKDIKQVPVEQFDLIINDFEPVTARAAKNKKIPIVSVSHQAAFWFSESPRPKKKNWIGELILKKYAYCAHHIGIHFQAYHPQITTPIIRTEVRQLMPINGRSILVYLPAYSDENLLLFFQKFPEHHFIIFSKRKNENQDIKNCTIVPISGDQFLKRMESCDGVLCGAGFETPAEALYLGKKLFVIPMKGQYEQKCNAAALEKLGIDVAEKLGSKIMLKKFRFWLLKTNPMPIYFPDKTEQLIKSCLELAINPLNK